MKSNNSNSIEANPYPKEFTKVINTKNYNNENIEIKNNIILCFFSKLNINIILISYLLNKLDIRLKFTFINIPLFTIYKLEFLRLITNFFICESFYELISGIFMISTIINFFEYKEGTILFFCKLFFNLFCSQIILLVIYYILSLFYPIMLIYRINSREFLCISFLVKHLLLTDSKKISNPLLGELNDRFILILFLLFYFFLNHEYRIDILLSLIYGFIMCKYEHFFDLQFVSQKSIEYIELSDFGAVLKYFDSFIPIEKAKNNTKPNSLTNLNFQNIRKNVVIDLNDESLELKEANDIEERDFNI
jgi:hypothetical protein